MNLRAASSFCSERNATMHPLPFRSPLVGYERQASDLLAGWSAGDEAAVRFIRHHHPRFLDSRVAWLPRPLSAAELGKSELTLADARLAVARGYSLLDWPSLVAWVEAAGVPGSPTTRFELAVEAVVAGDLVTLDQLLGVDADLVRARSTLVTSKDPPRHRATLLHYIAANGVEDFRQRTPPNAVAVATLLLRAGAEPDALADMYRAPSTTLRTLLSSDHPARAGVQVALAETLLDHGADVEGAGAGSPLLTALAFGNLDAAQALARRGARVETLPSAAGLGLADQAERRLGGANAHERHVALALAAQHGHTPIVALLLGAGEDSNRYNPPGYHAHSTPLHQAAWSGHLDTVRLLVERGAHTDSADTIWHATPLGWAEFGGQAAVAAYLRSVSLGD
jgi:ankyrin repeat protein